FSNRAPSSSSSSRTYFDRSALDRPVLRAAAEKPSASTTSIKARMRVSVSMNQFLPRQCSNCEHNRWIVQSFFCPRDQKTLDYDREHSYLNFSPKSHVPMGVRRSSMW